MLQLKNGNFLTTLFNCLYLFTAAQYKQCIAVKCTFALRNPFFFNFKANSPTDQNSFKTLATLVKNIEKLFKRKFCTTKNKSHLNNHDNSLLLVTTAVDPRYRL